MTLLRYGHVLLAVWVLVGCVPDLGGYRVLPPGVDGGPPLRPDAGVGGQLGGPCPTPSLLVTLEDLSGAAETVGRVLRYSITADELRACPSVDGGGQLSGQPFSVVGDDDFLVVSSRSGVQGVSGVNNRVEWSQFIEGHPNDSFRWSDPGSGEELYAIAWSTPGQCSRTRCTIRRVTVFDRAGTMRHDFSSLGVSSAESMTRSPLEPSRVLVVSPNNFAAAEYDLVSGTLFNSPAYIEKGSSHFPRIVSVLTQGGTHRLAWGGSDNGVDVAFHLDDATGSPGQSPFSVAACGCELVAVVPDPTRPRGLIGSCSRGVVGRDLVRIGLDAGGTCQVVVRGADMPDTRMSSVTLAGL